MLIDIILFVVVLLFYALFVRWITLYLWHGKSVIKGNAEKAIKVFEELKKKVLKNKKAIINKKIRKIKNWACSKDKMHFSEDS
ncbi:MAG: hypothetical protein R6U52_00780 [Kosmotogaceae bacterium]